MAGVVRVAALLVAAVGELRGGTVCGLAVGVRGVQAFVHHHHQGQQPRLVQQQQLGRRVNTRRPSGVITQMGLFSSVSRAQMRAKSLLESNEYDYIIAGGGTAGCVLANRLSADPSTKVLVLEAGRASASHPYVRIPTAVLKLFKSKWDWNFASEPAPQLAERQIYLCRGKGLGGSSLVNVMLYTRGAAADYDAWAEACGDDTWRGAEMLRYFTKAEECLSTENAGAASEWHGRDGPAAVSDVPYVHPLSESFLEAAKEAGFPANADFNDWSKPQVGFGRYQVSQRGGARESAASAYLPKDVRKRPNLDVVEGAVVKRVTFDAQTRRATGVEVLLAAPGDDPIVDINEEAEDNTRRKKKRETNTVSAFASLALSSNPAAEVALTAGAVGSPQVLMLSGVGARAELERFDIPVVADRPGVGKNLQDHPACLVSHFSNADAPKSHSTALRVPGTTATNPIAAAKWLFARKGPLTSPGCDHGGFLSVDATRAAPDVQLRFLATKSITSDGMSTIAKNWKATRNHPDGFTVQTICARPTSTDGSVTLASADPLVKPKIKAPYFTDERDLDVMVAALKTARDVMRQPALRRYAADEEFPGADVTTDDQLKAYARETAHTANALVGTCKLGRPETDADAVVDNHLKVFGVDGLRVCDSSVMPTLPGGQTASSTIAIAEKAADMFEDAKRRGQQVLRETSAKLVSQKQVYQQRPVAA